MVFVPWSQPPATLQPVARRRPPRVKAGAGLPSIWATGVADYLTGADGAPGGDAAAWLRALIADHIAASIRT